MTKLRFAFLFAFGTLLAGASSVDAQDAPIIGTVQSGMAASSVVEASPFNQPAAVYESAPVYQSAPAVSTSGCTSCGLSASATPATQITGPVTKSCSGCCLPGPTVAPGIPQLPIQSCCSNTGRLNIPPLTTPLRYDTPPIGRSVGRPLFGAWSGY